jgi:IclR family acetate operon transcriptional repressor
VPAIERTVLVLRALGADDGPRRLSDLSRALGVSKSTLSELLSTLEHYGLVERDDESRAYRLGYALLDFGNAVLRGLDLRQIARPHLIRLRDAIGETAVLHVPTDDGALIADRVESDHELKVTAPIGHRIPQFAGAVAKVFLAWLPDDEVNRLLGRALPAFTSRSITDPHRYRRELTRVRSRGYAADSEEYLPGVRAASAPVFDAHPRPAATITIVGYSARLTDERLRAAAAAAQQAAEEISRRAGAPGTRGKTSAGGL